MVLASTITRDKYGHTYLYITHYIHAVSYSTRVSVHVHLYTYITGGCRELTQEEWGERRLQLLASKMRETDRSAVMPVCVSITHTYTCTHTCTHLYVHVYTPNTGIRAVTAVTIYRPGKASVPCATQELGPAHKLLKSGQVLVGALTCANQMRQSPDVLVWHPVVLSTQPKGWYPFYSWVCWGGGRGDWKRS